MVSHAQARTRLVEQYRAIPAGDPVRLAKRTSNLFRPRDAQRRAGAGRLGSRQRARRSTRTRAPADVQAMTTYEHLVDATLAHGLMPLGRPAAEDHHASAVRSPGSASSRASFRNGLPHESVREVEVLTGAGEVVVATPTASTPTCSARFPNSYGTLGYALRLVIDLEPVQPFVRLRHVRFDDLDALTDGDRRDRRRRGRTTGERVDFLDGTVFTGRRGLPHPRAPGPTTAPYTSDYTGSADLLPVDPAATRRLPDRARLPVALGHRLVLVLAGVRRAEPADPPGLAEALAAQRRLLEDDRAREPLPRRGAARAAARGCRRASGSCRTSRSRSTRTADFLRLVPARGADRAGLAVPAPAARRPAPRHFARHGERALAALPAAARRDLRQRRLLVDRADRRRAGPTATSTGASRQVVTEHGRAQVALLRRLLRPRTSSGRSTAARTTTRRSSVTTRQSRLLDLYAKAVKRR